MGDPGSTKQPFFARQLLSIQTRGFQDGSEARI